MYCLSTQLLALEGGSMTTMTPPLFCLPRVSRLDIGQSAKFEFQVKMNNYVSSMGNFKCINASEKLKKSYL